MSDVTPGASSAPESVADAPEPVRDSTAGVAEFRAAAAASRAAQVSARLGRPASAPPSSADQPAAAAAAQPGQQAEGTPSLGKTPASEPGRPSGHKGNAETRVQELLAERRERDERIARLEAELAGKRTPPTETRPPADSSPATAADDPEPTLESFINDPSCDDPDAAYNRALARWEGRQAYREEKAREEQAREAREAEEAQARRHGTFRERITQEIKAAGSPEAFWQGISPAVQTLKTVDAAIKAGEKLGPRNLIAEKLIDSDHAMALMRHWTDHPEELKKIETARTPDALLSEFYRQEARLAHGAAGSTPSPEPKTHSDAPPPPTRINTGSPSTAGDPEMAAVRAGDVEAFRAEKRRQRLANLR